MKKGSSGETVCFELGEKLQALALGDNSASGYFLPRISHAPIPIEGQEIIQGKRHTQKLLALSCLAIGWDEDREGANHMGSNAEEHIALMARLPKASEISMLEIAQPSMHNFE